MDATARRLGCQPLASDCCQTHGERTAPSSHQVMPPAPLSSPVGASVLVAAAPLLSEPSWEELGPPAILQGIGLHTLHSVFLI